MPRVLVGSYTVLSIVKPLVSQPPFSTFLFPSTEGRARETKGKAHMHRAARSSVIFISSWWEQACISAVDYVAFRACESLCSFMSVLGDISGLVSYIRSQARNDRT